MTPEVASVFEAWPEQYREPLLRLRALIYEVAEKTPGAWPLEESLKWGQPSYTTAKTKMGTPIRLGRFGEDKIALFFHCQTSLVEDLRPMFSDVLTFSENRAIVIDPAGALAIEPLALCIEMALTYHKSKAK